jgi:hypothetical protein
MNKKRGFIGYLFVVVIAAAVLLIILYVWKTNALGINFSSAPTENSPAPTDTLLNFGSNNLTSPSSGTSISSSNNSPYKGSVSLSSGDAESEYQIDDQYIEIYNNGSSAVDISGWTLENAYGERPLQTTGNQAVYVAPEKVTIPFGTNFLNPSGNFVTGPIILQPGDTAIVTTGGPFVSYPFEISTSFRVNKCAGYLNYTYPFEPQINDDCPSPQSETGIDAITDVCYDYVRELPTCYDPAVQDKTNLKDNFQQNCIDYIDTHFNYAACVVNHENDTDFNQPTWRIFLGLNHELWHQPDDSIKLFDGNGKLVDEIDY